MGKANIIVTMNTETLPAYLQELICERQATQKMKGNTLTLTLPKNQVGRAIGSLKGFKNGALISDFEVKNWK